MVPIVSLQTLEISVRDKPETFYIQRKGDNELQCFHYKRKKPRWSFNFTKTDKEIVVRIICRDDEKGVCVRRFERRHATFVTGKDDDDDDYESRHVTRVCMGDNSKVIYGCNFLTTVKMARVLQLWFLEAVSLDDAINFIFHGGLGTYVEWK